MDHYCLRRVDQIIKSPEGSDGGESHADTGSIWCDLCTHQRGHNTEKQDVAYKFKQEGVLSQRSDAAGKTQDEHYTSNDNEEPHRVEAPEVCYRWQIGQHALGGGEEERRLTDLTNTWVKTLKKTKKTIQFLLLSCGLTARLTCLVYEENLWNRGSRGFVTLVLQQKSVK